MTQGIAGENAKNCSCNGRACTAVISGGRRPRGCRGNGGRCAECPRCRRRMREIARGRGCKGATKGAPHGEGRGPPRPRARRASPAMGAARDGRARCPHGPHCTPIIISCYVYCADSRNNPALRGTDIIKIMIGIGNTTPSIRAVGGRASARPRPRWWAGGGHTARGRL